MSPGDLLPFGLDEVVINRWPRRVVLALVLLAIALFANLGETAPRVFFAAVVALWLLSEALEVVLLKQRQP